MPSLEIMEEQIVKNFNYFKTSKLSYFFYSSTKIFCDKYLEIQS